MDLTPFYVAATLLGMFAFYEYYLAENCAGWLNASDSMKLTHCIARDLAGYYSETRLMWTLTATIGYIIYCALLVANMPDTASAWLALSGAGIATVAVAYWTANHMASNPFASPSLYEVMLTVLLTALAGPILTSVIMVLVYLPR
jgi:predicted ribosomally synthesized peptide with SipW-like signal peptide